MKDEFPNDNQLVPMVLAAATNGVIDIINEHNGDVDSIFGNSGVDAAKISDPVNELELKRFCDLLETAATQTHYSYFGLSFGSAFKPRMLGALGYLSINAPTLYSAITNLVRYFPAHQDNTVVSLTHSQGLYQINYEIADPKIINRRHDAELTIGIFCNVFKHCLGDRWSPVEVHFAHHCIDETKAVYEKELGCPVLFGQNTNSLLFRHTELDTLMPNSDPMLFSILEVPISKRRVARSTPCDLLTEVRHYIKVNISDTVPTLAEVAASFNMSTCHLQRELKNQGFCFNDIVRASRKELALRYVAETDMQLTEVAFALGYSELSAFSRAFKYWTNMSPQKYRHLVMTQGASGYNLIGKK